ncbi:ATP-binding protein [Inhella sp.]|uniref:sensor histidine kinase n=1 Tax=Inhella sp. TaxID=1921806 RepID=UPI0035B3D5B2
MRFDDVSASLTRQIGWRLALLMTAILLALALLAYATVQRLVRDSAADNLQRQVQAQVEGLGQPLRAGQTSVARLHAEWLRRAQASDAQQLAKRFDALFARDPDGVWRLRPAWLDPETRPTFYLQHGPQGPSEDARFRAVLSYELLSEQGPAMVPPHFSAYVDFVEKGLMVFSRGIDWGRGATPQTDNFDYPTMQGSAPARNPLRQPFWTPVYFDSEAKVWMVSVIQPLDWRGRWVGTVGHDLTVDALLQEVGRGAAPDATALVVSPAGELIAHPKLRERIAQAQGQLSLAKLNDPVLNAMWNSLRDYNGMPPVAQLSADGQHLVAWARVPGPGWWAVQLLPLSTLDDKVRRVALGIVLGGMLGMALALFGLRRVLQRKLAVPLARLEGAVRTLGEGEVPGPVGLQGRDELAQLARAFDQMARQLLAQREAEQAHARDLQTLNETLEARVQARTQDLSQANQRLQDSLSQLQQAQQELVQKETLAGLGALVAGVAHELNTPLGNALMATDTARDRGRSVRALLERPPVRRGELVALMAEQAEALTLALGNVERAAGLVTGFKQVAVDRAGLVRRRFKVRAVVEEVVALLSLSLKRHPFELRLDLPPELELEGYPGAFGQVITNLVQNAVLHGLEGRSDGLVQVRLLEADADAIVLAVEDNGCGIPPEMQSAVFRPFFTTKLGQGGSGLGLHIVYSLVTGPLGGKVELQSTPGQGARFELKLPRCAPPEAG